MHLLSEGGLLSNRKSRVEFMNFLVICCLFSAMSGHLYPNPGSGYGPNGPMSPTPMPSAPPLQSIGIASPPTVLPPLQVCHLSPSLRFIHFEAQESVFFKKFPSNRSKYIRNIIFIRCKNALIYYYYYNLKSEPPTVPHNFSFPLSAAVLAFLGPATAPTQSRAQP